MYGKERDPKPKALTFKKRPAACLEGQNIEKGKAFGAPAAGYRPVSFRPPWLSLRENRQKEITSPAFPKTILFPGGGLLKAVLVSRQSLSFYALVRLRSSRAGPDSGGTPQPGRAIPSGTWATPNSGGTPPRHYYPIASYPPVGSR